MRPGDLSSLMAAVVEANDRVTPDGPDPVLQAVGTPVGFVYIHPFEGGNGRLHRCLIQHILAERKITRPWMAFPFLSVSPDLTGLEVAENSL